jgi:hypothetical protein
MADFVAEVVEVSARTGSSHSRNNLRGYEFRDVVLIAPTRAKVVAPVSSEERSCVYVPITHNGKVVDSQGFILDSDEE